MKAKTSEHSENGSAKGRSVETSAHNAEVPDLFLQETSDDEEITIRIENIESLIAPGSGTTR